MGDLFVIGNIFIDGDKFIIGDILASVYYAGLKC